MTFDSPLKLRRTGLQHLRDISLTVMAFLVSILCVILLFVLYRTGSALAELGERAETPITVPTFDVDPIPTGDNGEPCIGEVTPPGC